MRNKPYPFYEAPDINDFNELLDYTAEKYGDAPAIVFERGGETVSISYRKLRSDTAALGAALLEQCRSGRQDDGNLQDSGRRCAKIALIGENSYEWILTYFAAVCFGNVVVPLDRELPKEDIRHIADDSGAEVFVYSDTYSDIAEYLESSRAPACRYYINMNSFPELMRRASKAGASRSNDCKDALAAILYTSGTTGTAKGVMLSHYSIISDTAAACRLFEIAGSNMLVLPLHHSFSLAGGVLVMLAYGSTIYISGSLKTLLPDLVKYKPRTMMVVPLFVETFYKKIWENAGKQGKDKLLKMLIAVSNVLLKIGIDMRRALFQPALRPLGGNLELLYSGAAPLDVKYIRGLRAFGINVLSGYGTTECSPAVSMNRNRYYRDGSAGQVFPCCEVKIARPDENGHGEILVKGSNVMLGYYNNEKATQEAFDGGWFKTGDIGYLDKDGFLYITGRIKNIIVLSNGKNIYPEEIENILIKIPLVKEVVVRGDTASKGSGDILTAEIFPDFDAAKRSGTGDLQSYFEQAAAGYNKSCPPYKRVQRVTLRETEFKKTTGKKIKRNEDAGK